MSDVILLHGLLANSVAMRCLERHLARRGLRVHRLSYKSVTASIEENVEGLANEIAALPGLAQSNAKVHIVAHSFGGIMALHLLDKRPDVAVDRMVMLGTPLGGSYVAKQISRSKLLGWLVANSMPAGLDGEHGFVDFGQVEVGMIAGSTKPAIGFGLLVGGLSEASDGSVLVSETAHPALREHTIVNHSHTGLIVSAKVAKRVVNFLKFGRF